MTNELEEKYRLASQRLRESRKENKYTIQEIADILGVTRQTVTRWETDTCKAMRLQQVNELSKLFNVNPLWLLGDNVSKLREPKEITQLREELKEIIELMPEEQLLKLKKFMDDFFVINTDK